MSIETAYSVEVDNVNKDTWEQILCGFDDANIFQTWAYGSHQWGEKNLSHLMLKRDGKVVAAAQIWLTVLPFINIGFAHVSWGPMWRLKGEGFDINVCKIMISALKEEYVRKRNLLLRIRSYSVNATNEGLMVFNTFREKDFKRVAGEQPYHTYRIDLTPELQELRLKLKPKWRRDLNKAEREDLVVYSGADDEVFRVFSNLYNDMLNRKRFKEYIANMDKYSRIQAALPHDMKMQIFLCRHNEEVVAGVVIPIFGDTGMDLLAATSTRCTDLKLHAAYLLKWRVIEWLKQEGVRYYDLRGGISGDMPGVQQFKSGLSGDEISYLGTLECCNSKLSRLTVRTAEFLSSKYKKTLLSHLFQRVENCSTL